MSAMNRPKERPNEPTGGRPYRQQPPAASQRYIQRIPFFNKYDIPRRCAGIITCIQTGLLPSASEEDAQKYAKHLSDHFSDFYQESESLAILIVCLYALFKSHGFSFALFLCTGKQKESFDRTARASGKRQPGRFGSCLFPFFAFSFSYHLFLYCFQTDKRSS